MHPLYSLNHYIDNLIYMDLCYWSLQWFCI